MKQRKQFVERLEIPCDICEHTVRTSEKDLEWSKAFSEVYQLICYTEAAIRKSIPESFMSFLKEQMDEQWHGDLDFSKNMDEMNLLKNTRIILSLIYRDFICSEDERKRLVEEDRIEAEKKGIIFKDESLRESFKT